MLGNIFDNFSFQEVENINFSKIDIIDSFILNKISELDENFGKYLETNDFHKIYVELLNFCTTDLSSFYFDIRKDALYCDDLDSIRRLNCVSVLKVSLYFLWLGISLT